MAGAVSLSDVDGAHRQLLRQGDLQFTLPPVQAPDPPPPWLKPLLDALGRLFKIAAPRLKFLEPVMPYLLWGVLIFVVGLILVLIMREALGMGRGGVGAKLRLGAEPDAVWRPAPAAARSLLEEADRLAEQGLYVDAAHLILLRSIEDIQKHRPRRVAVSFTARDIARLPGLPDGARATFAGIAEAVERSLFGGRPLDREGFVRCRQAYEAFADIGVWAGAGA
jgi:hypothetical protein